MGKFKKYTTRLKKKLNNNLLIQHKIAYINIKKGKLIESTSVATNINFKIEKIANIQYIKTSNGNNKEEENYKKSKQLKCKDIINFKENNNDKSKDNIYANQDKEKS